MQLVAAHLLSLLLTPVAAYRLNVPSPQHRERLGVSPLQPQMVLRLDPEAASEALSLPGIEGAEASKGPFGKGGALEWLATATDAFAAVTLATLHAFDDKEVQDSSKNLQVLWARAILANSGVLDDNVAYNMLPESTRGIVSKENVALFEGLLPWAEWIQARTVWIDEACDAFMSSPSVQASEAQVVVFGAGFDTRSIRYQREGIHFFEVDLPDTIAAKRVVHERYASKHEGTRLPSLMGFDLNDCAKESLIDRLVAEHGFKRTLPTLFISEAVLFYVEPAAIAALYSEIFSFGSKTEAQYCFTDSMRPFVQGPFVDEIKPFMNSQGIELLAHTSRWGGAVQFVQAASQLVAPGDVAEAPDIDAAKKPATEKPATLLEHVASRFDTPVNTYAPAVSLTTQMEEPSFSDTWYAIGTSEQVPADKPFATRLWGEPIVLYRDAEGNAVALKDVCPHRSAPLSMGDVEDGVLRCFYHGWAFGKEGNCVDVPTMRLQPEKKSNLDSCSATHYAVMEHEGLVWVWRGNPLTADARKLPRHPAPEQTLPVDTILDYGCDWTYIVENNLDSPHLYWLHDGSIPPLESLGFVRSNISKVALRSFKDDIGVGHIGKTGTKGTTKVIRFDAPNVVRHCGVSGFSEEFHIIPVAPHRTRVILRQRFPNGPILQTLLAIPGALSLLTWLVRNWNYHISLEDYPVMQGQAHNIDDLGAPQWKKTSLGDDLIIRFWEWNRQAEEREGKPYFTRWDGSVVESLGGKQTDDNAEVGTYGLKRSYVQNTPVAEYAPINYGPYKSFLDRVETATKAATATAVGAPTAFITLKTAAPAVASALGL